MSGRIDFTMDFNTKRTTHKSDSDNFFRLYILGNFSARSDVPWEQRKIRGVDSDNFDQVMNLIMPTFEIETGLALKIETLDDFHPDTWFGKIQILANLQKLKKELSSPSTAEQAAMKIQAYYPSATKNDASIPTKEATESQEDILQRLLGKSPENTIGRKNSVNQFIDQIVSPYVMKDTDLQHQALIKVIDSTSSQYLQTLLHRQDFQRLEALWRATETLVKEESGDEQSFFLVDISQTELLAELRKDSGTFEQRLLQHVQSGDGEQDIILIGDYCFSSSVDDRDLLTYCSRLAKICGGCFLSGADISLLEDSISAESGSVQNWTQYLKEISADRVILAYPRYLLRLPYGNRRDPIEAFEFEECSVTPQTNELLWGNPAFICARVLIKTSQGHKNEDQAYFGDVPAFTFDHNGEHILQPGTEILLNETQANALLAKGITPLIGFRQRQGIRLVSISTLSEHSLLVPIEN